MTLEETVAILTPLALAMRVDLDAPTYRAYHQQLEKVPAPLAQAAIADLSDAGMRFLPTAPEIKQASERKRRQLLAAHPYDGCAECEDHRGFRYVLGGNGQPVVEKCPCKARWQHQIAGIGALEPLAALPGEVGSGAESEAVFPTLEQLPEPVRKQLTAMAGRKALR